ncbi:MAG: tetratricopeptide repeat protein [Rhodospirillaceae bacterium]|nr:tetratricopeptide repeat protein [Rhodospirillaceae bacterium]
MIIEQDGTPINDMPAAGELIKNSDVSTFVVDVVEQSKTVPVIVNFGSPRSAPCMQLTATLEKLVSLGGGIVKMVNVNVDENQQLAAQLQVQTVPTVFGFKHGQPIDAFAGVQPESQVKAFIKRLTGDAKAPIEEALEQARALLDDGAPEQASAIYAQVLAQEQSSGPAIAGLIRCYLAAGEIEHAKSLIEGLEESTLKDGDVQAAMTALELAEAGGAGGDSEEFRAKLAANDNDHQARFDLAMSLYGAGNAEEALEQLLEIIRRDRAWNDDAARQQMLKIFEALGHSDPVTAEARRNLSTVLFS